MSENTKLWDALARTDPAQTKGFKRSGGFAGTAVKPIYCDQRMTEHFGPCGEKWGIDEPNFQVVQAGEETMVYCWVSIWIKEPTHKIFGVGGDKVVMKTTNGLKTSDEAFKMAFTDAVGNAYKRLGMSADIHMGLFDDSKYVNDLRREFAAEPVQAAKPSRATKEPPAPASGTSAPAERDFPSWIKCFRAEFNEAPSHLAAQDVYRVNLPILNQLKAARPNAYVDLMAWVKAEGEKKPLDTA